MNQQITIAAVLIELRRELGVREFVYLDWIQSGRIAASTAAHRMACIEAAIDLIESMPTDEPETEQMSLLG